ncbi:hypothetical protein [Streptomyces sp. Rer75]|uniref:effector-associated constant component EACC1 n=1 Tax=Streptomyces sp. Rer75 TaxID=2750011 RepID=UPI0015CFF5C0|nr:hypothetical protein [Streptomyces sp. Rer75]QLH21042.1 hypothetical protein HYQ63_10785 [Streptomyces sp. Rer75]
MEQRMQAALRVEISAEADDGDLAIHDLYRWLRQDTDVRAHADLNMIPSPSRGKLEIIDLVVSQGLGALNLGLSYAAWRAARPTAPAVIISANGRSITVRGECDAETVRHFVEAMESASAPSPTPAADADSA